MVSNNFSGEGGPQFFFLGGVGCLQFFWAGSSIFRGSFNFFGGGFSNLQFGGVYPIFRGAVSNFLGGLQFFRGVLQFFGGGSPIFWGGVSNLGGLSPIFWGGLLFFRGGYGQRLAGAHPTRMHSCLN